jgi:Xaa-Pro dipeptidase
MAFFRATAVFAIFAIASSASHIWEASHAGAKPVTKHPHAKPLSGCLTSFHPSSTRRLSSMHHLNRNKVVAQFKTKGGVGDGALLLAGGNSTLLYYSDTEVLFRQESNFKYVFGYEGADAVGLIDLASDQTFLFVPNFDTYYSIWNGPQMTLEEIEKTYGVKAHYVSQLDEVIASLAPPVIYTAPPPASANAFDAAKERTADMPYMPTREGLPKYDDLLKNYKGDVNSTFLLSAFSGARTVKNADEIDLIEIAGNVSSNAHNAIMSKMSSMMKDGRVHEFTVESFFLEQTYNCGLRHQSYIPIVGAGANGAVLHYNDATSTVNNGQMLLIDAGAEYGGYTTDITRTYPVNGVFTPRQREIYQTVLNAQQAAIDLMAPGVEYSDLVVASYKEILKGLKDAKLIHGDVEDMYAARIHSLFMPHGLGHSVGLDVHDPQPSGVWGRPLVEGNVLTIEPGLYFVPLLLEPAFLDPQKAQFLNKEAIEALFDFGGVRIEDVLLVTKEGHRFLGSPARQIDEIEHLMR